MCESITPLHSRSIASTHGHGCAVDQAACQAHCSSGRDAASDVRCFHSEYQNESGAAARAEIFAG